MESTESLLEIFEKWCRVGSRVCVRPPAMNTDEDFLCYSADWQRCVVVLAHNGWELGGSVPAEFVEARLANEKTFVSLKRGGQNIILTASEKFFERFVAATSIATRLNLFVKKDRIALFQAVLYANPDKEYAPKIEPSVTADELQAAAGL